MTREGLRMTRRALLVGAAGAAAYLALRGRGEEPPDVDAELEALRRASLAPGPAEVKLGALAPPPRRSAVPLPFARDAVPGFSAAAHHVHWNHHYLEYLWRWEEGERALLAGAAALLAEPESIGREAFATAMALRFEDVRAAANMVVLHEAYWRHLWSGLQADADPVLAQRLAAVGERCARGWTIAADVDGMLGTASMGPDFPSAPLGVVPLAGVDWQPHAWRLDFASLEAYAAGLLRTVSAEAREALALPALAVGDSRSPWLARNRQQASSVADADLWRRAVADLCADCGIAPDGVAEGLAEATPRSCVATVCEDIATGLRTLLVIPAEGSSGLWRHRPVAAAP